MEIVKTRDTSIAHRAARIWALATAKRDDNIADSDVEAAALPLIQDSLDSSERAFVLALMQEEDMLAFVAIMFTSNMTHSSLWLSTESQFFILMTALLMASSCRGRHAPAQAATPAQVPA